MTAEFKEPIRALTHIGHDTTQVCWTLKIWMPGEGFGDGEHILYVNGQYRGESDLGKLMHDFNCTKADDMNFDLMAERTRYLKENPKGVQEMCKAMEDMRNEAVLAERKEIARTFILMGELSYEKIAKGTKLTIEEIEKMAEKEKEIIYKSG